MRVAITGASGLIGTALAASLETSGHEVRRLVRRPARGPGEISWDPVEGTVDLDALAGTEAVVHLAGAGVGDRRWTPQYKRLIRDSRVLGTRAIATALTRLDPAPSVLLSGSAVGYYGDRGEEVLLESAARGDGFLADVVVDWEAETVRAAEAGVRTVLLRTGLVLSRHGGAVGRLLPILRLGLGGPIGDGRQWWPWITLADEVRAIEFLLERGLSGPVNLSAPQPARNVDVVRALGAALSRPTALPVPTVALRVALGEFASDITASQRVVPQALQEAGFEFEHPDLAAAAAWVTDTG